jgi:hypothetical protein
MDDDKEKSILGKLVDTVSEAVGSIAKAAVSPTVDPKAEAVAEKANEQMFLSDAAIAPEAVPAPFSKKRVARKRATKRAAKAVQKSTAKKTSKKS